MKKFILLSSLFFMALSSFSQSLITEDNGRVTVRTSNDSIITQIEPVGSGAISAVFNTVKSEIVVVYNDGNVIVKKQDGTSIVKIMEPCTDKAVAAIWSGDSVMITTQANQTLTKNALEWR